MLNRRNFLKSLGLASIGATVAYSFPSIIVPKNIISLEEVSTDYISLLNSVTIRKIYPSVIEDCFFMDSPLFARLKNNVEYINV